MNISNYNHLFYFYITAKLEGVTAAAKYLNTSQSSLSIQINTLEETLGKDLFHKAGRRMELTDTGRELYQYCRRAFDIFNEMFDQLDKNYSTDLLADDALFQLAELYENYLHDKAKAMDLYKDILLKYKGSIYVVEARKRFRELRGDEVN